MFAEVVKLPAEDGTELFGLIHDSVDEKDIALIFVHGLGSNGRCHLAHELAEFLPSKNIGVIRGDLRESDLLRLDEQPTKGRVRKGGGAYHPFSAGVRDLDLWVRAGLQRGYRRIVLFGHSLGSLRVIQYAAETRLAELAGIVLASTADLIALHESRYTQSQRENFLSVAEGLMAGGEGDELMPSECTVGLMRQPIAAAAYVDRYGGAPSWDVLDLFDRGSDLAFRGLREVTQPILATFGSHTETVPDERIMPTLQLLQGEAVSAASFEYKVFQGADHFYLNRGQEVASAVADWVVRAVPPHVPTA